MVRVARTAWSAVVLAVVAALCVVAYGPVGAAHAHAQLIDSSPKDAASLAQVPATVTLTFSDQIDPKFVRVAVTTPAGGPAPGTATTSGPVVTVPLVPTGPGAYQVVYRVVSADGHPVSGTLGFTVAGTPTASPTATASGSASPAASVSGSGAQASAAGRSSAAAAPSLTPTGSSGGSSTPLLLGIALVATLAVVVLRYLSVARARRGREQPR